MEAIFLPCGADGPQLKRTPLGSPMEKTLSETAIILAILASACPVERQAPRNTDAEARMAALLDASLIARLDSTHIVTSSK